MIITSSVKGGYWLRRKLGVGTWTDKTDLLVCLECPEENSRFAAQQHQARLGISYLSSLDCTVLPVQVTNIST